VLAFYNAETRADMSADLPEIAARATLALNLGEWLHLLRLMRSLQSALLILEEAVAVVH
jgi:hypothetical protein